MGDENMSTTVDSHRSSRRSLGPEKLTPGKLGRSKSAVELPKATLHSALTQMAAVLRVAKEGEVRLKRTATEGKRHVDDLNIECVYWKKESDRLEKQFKELRDKVQARSEKLR